MLVKNYIKLQYDIHEILYFLEFKFHSYNQYGHKNVADIIYGHYFLQIKLVLRFQMLINLFLRSANRILDK